MTRLFRPVAALAVLALVAAACGGDGGSSAEPTGGASGAAGPDPATFAAQLASSDHYVGTPQRVTMGVFSSTPEAGVLLVTGGEIEVTVAPFEDGPGTPADGTGRYIPAPGTTVGDGPSLRAPADARGVYELADVTFDEPGIWEARATFRVDGAGPFEVASTPFEVRTEPLYPAPGDAALKTDNLTVDSDAPPEAIDSGAVGTGEVPDPELHEWTIAEALRKGRPIVALFATPAFCESLFCGPVTDAVRGLAAEHDGKAAFVHVEIWREHNTVLNEAAADWLYRNDNLTEPWLYLIDGDGTIVDRWAPLFDVDEVGAAIEALPAS